MKRDLIKYAEQGRKHIKRQYDLSTLEAYELRLLVEQGVDGIYDAIVTAYCCGFEAGRRQTKAGMRA